MPHPTHCTLVTVDGGEPLTMSALLRAAWTREGHNALAIRTIEDGGEAIIGGHRIRVLGCSDDVCSGCYAPTPDACECAAYAAERDGGADEGGPVLVHTGAL